MADGRTHTAVSVSIGTSLALGAGVSYWLYPEEIAYLCIGCAVLGTFLTPDHDVDTGNITHFYWRKLIGTDWLWRVFWHPYAVAFSHRSLGSHGPVISTLLRWAYLISPIIVARKLNLYSIIAQLLAIIPICGIIAVVVYLGYIPLLLLFAGNLVADVGHWILDR